MMNPISQYIDFDLSLMKEHLLEFHGNERDFIDVFFDYDFKGIDDFLEKISFPGMISCCHENCPKPSSKLVVSFEKILQNLCNYM